MLIFCDESWKENEDGKKVGTLAAIAIEQSDYNDICDRVFLLAQKYWGADNARLREIKGKQLLQAYEFRRRDVVSMKLAFARELLEEVRRRQIKIFASVVFDDRDVELLCESPDRLDRPYSYLMERIHEYLIELGGDRTAIFTFDDRGLKVNANVGEAYRNFLNRSKTGRSYNTLIRTPFFAYSHHSVGIQLADLICTVINRFYTIRRKHPQIQLYYHIVQSMEWVASQPNDAGYTLRGIKIIGGQARERGRPPIGGED